MWDFVILTEERFFFWGSKFGLSLMKNCSELSVWQDENRTTTWLGICAFILWVNSLRTILFPSFPNSLGAPNCTYQVPTIITTKIFLWPRALSFSLHLSQNLREGSCLLRSVVLNCRWFCPQQFLFTKDLGLHLETATVVTTWSPGDNRGERVAWGWSGMRAGSCHQA